MKNKKGFLLGESTLKTVIAIIVILILVFLLANLYITFSNKPKIEKARASLERINEKVNEAYKNGQAEDVLYEPKDWVLINYRNGNPRYCSGTGCLCICPKTLFDSNQVDECDKVGVCKISDRKVLSFDEIKINGPEGLSFKKNNEEVILTKI